MRTSSLCIVLRGGGLVARRQSLATDSLLVRATESSYSELMRLSKRGVRREGVGVNGEGVRGVGE